MKSRKKLIALSQEALRLLPEQEKAIRSVNHLNIGYAYMALADLQATELAYKQTLEDGLVGGNYYAAIFGPINLVISDLLAGRVKEALHLCETCLERFDQILAGQISADRRAGYLEGQHPYRVQPPGRSRTGMDSSVR